MSEGVIRRSLTRGVGLRIFVSVLIAAIVPVMFTAWLAWFEFSRGLEDGTSRILKDSAKEYGIEILTRLQLASEKAGEIARVTRDGSLGDVNDHKYLLDDFEAIWMVGDDIPPTLSLDTDLNGISLDESDLEYLATGKTKLLVTPQGSLVMLLRHPSSAAQATMAFQLNAARLWGARENLPYNTEFCVFGESGICHYCTTEMSPDIHSFLVEHTDIRSGAFGEWEHDGETHFAALWKLFLSGSFGAPGIDIVAVQPVSFAMGSGTAFKRVFIPAIVVVLLLVAYLSLKLIARNLVPLQHLTAASRQLASGNLESRVRIRTKDEFESLADAFNNMASRLGLQISALEAMSGIDRMILAGTKFEDVSEEVVGHLLKLTRCQSAAVIARDVDAPANGKMISLHEGELLHERIELPGDVSHRWCQPRQVDVSVVGEADAPYRARFQSFGQNFVVLIPVILNDDLKGVLLLGFDAQFDMSRGPLQRVVDLAGRFAVALSSVEREEVLYRQAHFDELTGLPNRQLLKDRLEQHVSNTRIDARGGAILFLDLDRFKEINDVFGHSVGDVVLIQASKRIVAEVREHDTVARLGGDEFVVVLPRLGDEVTVRATAERLLDKLGEAFTVNDLDHYVSASIGIVMFPEDGDSVETLLKNADSAMYRAKDAGRGRFEFFSERLDAESRRKIGVERDLRRAFHNDEIEVHYQPQFNIATGEISGAEALLRWHHPEIGYVSPDEFVPLAEESGLIVDLGAWVLQRACRDLRELLDRGFHPGSVSINVSARQLREAGFRNDVMNTVRKFGIHPGYLQLEVTETAVAQNRDTAIELLQSLRNVGVRVAIDDFGTGYSSLSYLQQLPFDVIKIDKSFVEKVGSNQASDNICRTIIRMAEELGKKSIAEGVEGHEQLEFLRRNGCRYVQGYYYSEALPQEEFIKFVEKQDFHTRRRKALEIL